MKKVWNFFSSTSLTITLVLLICVDAAWGSWVVIKNQPFFQSLDRVILLKWLFRHGIETPGLTLWIFALIFLIFLFAVNTVVCTTDRVYSIIKGKRPLAAFLPQLVHIGFLVALLGHLLGSSLGFRSYDNVLIRGEIADAGPEGLKVRLDNSDIKLDSKGDVESLKASVTVIEDGKEARAGDITLNSPLIYKGTAVYYADQGRTITGLSLEMAGEEKEVPFGGSFSSGGRQFSLGRLYPDFALDREGNPYSLSDDYRNPYVEIISDKLERGYLKASYAGEAKIGNTVIRFRDYVVKPYAVLTVNRDPGIGFIIAGSAILVFGMVSLLFIRGERGELMRKKDT